MTLMCVIFVSGCLQASKVVVWTFMMIFIDFRHGRTLHKVFDSIMLYLACKIVRFHVAVGLRV